MQQRTACEAEKQIISELDGSLKAHPENEGWNDSTESYDFSSEHVVNCFPDWFQAPYATPHIACIHLSFRNPGPCHYVSCAFQLPCLRIPLWHSAHAPGPVKTTFRVAPCTSMAATHAPIWHSTAEQAVGNAICRAGMLCMHAM